MINDTFDKDMPFGEEAEKAVLSIVRKKYPLAHKIEGRFKYFDLFVPEKNITIEVKRDKGSNETSNYFIEYNCNGYNSGINSSRANFWAIYDESKLIWINKDKLKTISERYGYKWEGRTEGGCSPIKAYLVPKHYILDYSELITKLPLSS